MYSNIMYKYTKSYISTWKHTCNDIHNLIFHVLKWCELIEIFTLYFGLAISRQFVVRVTLESIWVCLIYTLCTCRWETTCSYLLLFTLPSPPPFTEAAPMGPHTVWKKSKIGIQNSFWHTQKWQSRFRKTQKNIYIYWF